MYKFYLLLSGWFCLTLLTPLSYYHMNELHLLDSFDPHQAVGMYVWVSIVINEMLSFAPLDPHWATVRDIWVLLLLVGWFVHLFRSSSSSCQLSQMPNSIPTYSLFPFKLILSCPLYVYAHCHTLGSIYIHCLISDPIFECICHRCSLPWLVCLKFHWCRD